MVGGKRLQNFRRSACSSREVRGIVHSLAIIYDATCIFGTDNSYSSKRHHDAVAVGDLSELHITVYTCIVHMGT